jgi:hypothetical protein
MSKKRELTEEKFVNDKMRALIDSAEYFNAGMLRVIASDDDGKIVGVAVYCTDDDAPALARWLERRDRREEKAAPPKATSGASLPDGRRGANPKTGKDTDV